MVALPDSLTLTLTPLPRPVVHRWPVPGSKSLTNRALAIAALAEGVSTISGPLASDDTTHMRRGLADLGIATTDGEGGWQVAGGRELLRPPRQPLFVGNSGTTVRFLAALAALVPGAVTLHGDAHMARRPIADLVAALDQLGIQVDCASGCPPLTVYGRGHLAGEVRVRGDRSSQFVSALLQAAAGSGQGLELRVSHGLVSRPYVTMTCALLEQAGIRVDHDGDRFHLHPGRLRATAFAIEPDASAATYPLALAAAGGGTITVPGLGGDSLQGDSGFAEVLAAIGARVVRRAGDLEVTGAGRRGIDVDLHHLSDTVPTLAAIAPLLEGPTTIRNVANIRLKETDRLAACATELARLGQEVSQGEDWLRITPRPVVPAVVECYADHRMAMAFAVLGSLAPGVTIADPACVAKTYPGFWTDLAACHRAAGKEVTWAP